MAKPFSVHFTDPTDGPVTVSGEFADDDWRLLLEFAEAAARLARTAHVRSGGHATLAMAWRENVGLVVEAQLPARAVFAEFLHELRPFLLESEPIYYPRTARVLNAAWTHPYLRRGLAVLDDLFAGRRLRSLAMITAGDLGTSSDRAIVEWVSAFEFQRDRRAGADSSHVPETLRGPDAVVAQLLGDKAKAVLQLAGLIGACDAGGGSAVRIRGG